MLKKAITYQNLDGVTVTEDFYFNLTKAELAELELTHEGGLRAYLTRIVSSQDRKEILSTFKMLISITVGRRSEDGRRFEKSPEITAEFMQTDAYSELVMSFYTDPGAAAQFVAGVMPKDLVDKVDMAAVEAQALEAMGEVQASSAPVVKKKLDDYTTEELEALPYEEFVALLAASSGNIPKRILILAMQRAAKKE